MRTKTLGFVALIAGVLAPVTVATRAAEESPGDHRTGLAARITMRDGSSGSATLDGLGCTASICSRTLIKGNGGLVRAWLDSLAAIEGGSEDWAWLVSKDGSRTRMWLMKDFRVLYLEDGHGRGEKLDLARVKSVEFAAPAVGVY